MSKNFALKASARSAAGKGAARRLRKQGMIPAVVYGEKQPPTAISMSQRDFSRSISPKFFTTVFEIDVDGTVETAIPRDVQLDPVSDQPVHVDFLRVSGDARVTVEIPVKFINEAQSPGLKRGAVLNIVRYSIEVSAPWTAIPELISCDLAGAVIGDTIHVSSVNIPEGVVPTITDRDFTIATIAVPSALKQELAKEASETSTDEESDN